MKARTSAGSTFRVHDVETVRTPISTCKTRDSITNIIAKASVNLKQEPVFWCTDYNSEVIADVQYHALLAAIHIAFSEHRPLVLSPDFIWIAILQGVAQHVHLHSEALREVLVSHQGRKKLQIVMPNFDPDSPESEWDKVITKFADMLNSDAAGSAALVSDFSTTGPLEKLVSQAAVLDVYESYYEYVCWAGCGFPEITLTGTSDDWLKLLRKLDLLEPFRMDFWLPHLREIAGYFYDASCGRVDLEVWQDMYKQMNLYGGDICNGWIAKLIPYTRNDSSGNWDKVNPLLDEKMLALDLDDRHMGIYTNELASGMSVVPFVLIDEELLDRPMEIVAGFVGVEQDEDGRILPKLGCATRSRNITEWLFLTEDKIQLNAPLPHDEMDRAMHALQDKARWCLNISNATLAFYKHCDGFSVPAMNGSHSWRLLPLNEADITSSLKINDVIVHEVVPDNDLLEWVIAGRTLRFAESSDGRFATVGYHPPHAEVVSVCDADGKCRHVISKMSKFVEMLLNGEIH